MVATADIGNGAERAEAVAPVRDLYVFTRRIVERDLVAILLARFPEQPVHDLDDVVFLRAGDDTVCLGELGIQVIAVTGWQASAHHQLGIARFHPIVAGNLENGIQAFLGCRLDERARVHNYAIARLFQGNDVVTSANEILLHMG